MSILCRYNIRLFSEWSQNPKIKSDNKKNVFALHPCLLFLPTTLLIDVEGEHYTIHPSPSTSLLV